MIEGVVQMVYQYIAVAIVASVVSMALGMLWYSPVLFGRLWMQLSGIKEKKEKKSGMSISYLAAFIGTAVNAGAYIYLYEALAVVELLEAIKLGAIIWLGFMATTTLSSVLWEKKPVKLYLLNNAHLLLSNILTAILVYFML